MKRFLLLVLVISAVSILLSMSVEEYLNRQVHIEKNHAANNVRLRVSNFGVFGAGNNYPRWPSLEYPPFSGTDYLYHSALWVGAKITRRDTEGNIYYWQNWPPDDENDVIAENSPDFNPGIHTIVVVDTLASVGYEGDYQYYELLPAYWSFEEYYIGDQYWEYYPYDIAVRSILGIPSLSDESFPYDPSGIYDFFMPLDEPGDFPGIETMTSFYYDYSPFTPWGEIRHSYRKYGNSVGQFMRYPLYLSIRQRSFAFAYHDLYDMIFFSYDIYNSSPIDTLYDVAAGFYVDSDVGPQDWDGEARAEDDVSGYYAGEGYEFAYTRDYDGDGGLSPHWIASKIFPQEDQNFACYAWERGDGPNDRRPRRIPPLAGLTTSNEKYWLLTGRNANQDKFDTLRPEDWIPGMEPHYEQTEPHDTRFLYSIYGDMQGYDEPTSFSLNLAPGESITLNGVIFLGDDLDDLKSKSLLAQAFYDSGYDMSIYEGIPFIPFIISAEVSGNNLLVQWVKDEGADTQYIYYKLSSEPDTAWEIIELDIEDDNYVIEELTFYETYDVKVVVVYDTEVLESVTWKVYFRPVSIDDDYLVSSEQNSHLIGNFPNPFNPDTKIVFYLEKPSDVKLQIFNIKGQLVTTLVNQRYESGFHTLVWDSKDYSQKEMPSGIYIYRLITTDLHDTKKMLLLK
ncbi:MAG: T9SS type A sorting domain-containing protein [Candidatus Cloacimonetes bacterium]|nr:T9SS type A sorting domain-containing protein [Candidatus Cloacimonadota bacterium]